MWTVLPGLVLLVGLVLAAVFLGQAARRRFPRSYAAVDKAISSLELVFIIVVFLGALYFTR
jgi:hypothetical protein